MTEERPTTQQTQLVKHVFALTQAIEEAASLADWQRAARLAEERSPLLMSIRREQEPASLALIDRIMTIDHAVMDEARQSRDELEVEYHAAMERSRSASKYHNIARL
jgi:hypothetical protein